MTQKSGKGVVKTIYLPNDHLNTVALENDDLKRILEEERIICLNKADQLREELRNRENELARTYEWNQEQIKELLKRNQTLEKDNVQLVKGILIQASSSNLTLYITRLFRTYSSVQSSRTKNSRRK